MKRRKRLNKAENSRVYNMILKNLNLYCYTCVRRGGGYNCSCAPSGGRWRERLYRSWKYDRKTQWKEK